MSSKKIDAWLNTKNALRCVFILALAVAMAAGAALYNALNIMVHTSIASGLPPSSLLLS